MQFKRYNYAAKWKGKVIYFVLLNKLSLVKWLQFK